MATRRTREQIEADAREAFENIPEATPIPGDRELMLADDEPEESAVERIQRMMREVSASAGAVVKLYRINAAGAFAWCDDWSPEEFEDGGEKLIRQKWGAGKYELRLIGLTTSRSGKALRAILAKSVVTVEDAPGSAGVAAAPSSDVARTLELLAKQQSELIAAIANRPPVDPMAAMRESLSMMSMMREAMGLNAQPAKSSIAEIMEAVREMRAVAEEINPPREENDPNDPMAMLPKILDLVKAGREMQPQQAPAPQFPDGYFPPVALPPSFAAAPVPVPASGDLQPVTQPQDSAAMSEDHFPKTQPTPDAGVMELKAGLDALIAMAMKGEPPSMGSVLIADRLPDEMIDFLDAPGWFDLLARFAPQVAPHREWFEKAKDGAIELLFEDEPNVTPADGAKA